ncbi:MAG: NADH-quinone oxidoreductase subunit L, partial [Nitrospira sp.]|nr:NADH-quinone oxidoreductase subunit L [Nitrospira sp.]
MSFVILIPLLPLLATAIVLLGRSRSQDRRAKIGVLPIVAAFLGAIATLGVVATHGPIAVRFYDPAAAGSFPVPL